MLPLCNAAPPSLCVRLTTLLSFALQVSHDLHGDGVHVREVHRRRRGLQDRKVEPRRLSRVGEHRKIRSRRQTGWQLKKIA